VRDGGKKTTKQLFRANFFTSKKNRLPAAEAWTVKKGRGGALILYMFHDCWGGVGRVDTDREIKKKERKEHEAGDDLGKYRQNQ